jgi:hypothetical protein
MAIQIHKRNNTTPDAPYKSGGAIKTPAPSSKVQPVAKGGAFDPLANSKAYGRSQYGSNAYGGASSTDKPGDLVESDLAAEIRGKFTDLDAVINHSTGPQQLTGLEHEGSPQTRAVSSEMIAPAHGMKNPNAAPVKIPSKMGRGD